ncbi:MAG: phospho-N-acetylmuramoyl-pentapeptide-transferase, partial [Erysipelotrichaceae bacterium]|nr:phospho-N-acetylmuramoyl-pentapeptide-transferase [Erysipelotrichaceae bacterium]
LIGFIDDFIIVVKKDNEGLKPKYKLFLQSVLAVVFYLMYRNVAPSTILIPFFNITIDLGWFYFVLVFLMFTAETNAVNFSDGLDGLCAGLTSMALAPFVLFAVLEQQYELAMFLLALIGALFGYLKYNMYPAKIMMGDTGSLALGGALAASAMVLKQEIALVIIGGVFVVEMLSVVIQVGYFKISHGKRVFKMAPIHHHFELSGFKETQVVMMFWFAGFICSIIGILMGVMM